MSIWHVEWGRVKGIKDSYAFSRHLTQSPVVFRENTNEETEYDDLRQEDISFRLAEWLLDQLQSHDALNMVANQFAAMINQTRQRSRGDLYAHVSQLIFQRTLHGVGNLSIKLLAQLCHGLFIKAIQPNSGIADKNQYIHERVFQLCIGSLESDNLEKRGGVQAVVNGASTINGTNRGTSASALGSLEIGHISCLISDLREFGLISIAQIFEYLSHLVVSPAPIQARLIGLCELLETCGLTTGIGAEHWATERKFIIEWASGSISKRSIDECTRGRVEVRP